jgi:hypothetical protein
MHAMARTVLHMHKDYIARSEPSTTPHFVLGDKLLAVTKKLSMRGQPNRKLRDRQLGPFTFEEHIGEHSYILRLPTTFCLHPVIHVNRLRPCSTTSLRRVVRVTVPEGDDEDLDVSHISDACIKSLH